MLNYRLADPCFTNFEPSSAAEAIIKFRRLQTAGLASWRYPEAFVDCCAKLSGEEISKFEEWVVCPQGLPSKDAVSVEVFSVDNEKTHALLVQENEDRVAAREQPSSVPSSDDEKCPL